MNRSFSRARQAQMHSGEKTIAICRACSVSLLFILYLLLTGAWRSLQPRHLVTGSVLLVSLGCSLALPRYVRAGRLSAGGLHLAAVFDTLVLSLFLGAFLLLPPGRGENFALVSCAALGLAWPALALLRLLPANVLVTGGSATLGFAAAALYAIVADRISLYYIVYLPIFMAPGAALLWLIGLRYTRLLDIRQAGEKVPFAIPRSMQSSIANLGQLVGVLESLSGGISAGAQAQTRIIEEMADTAGKLQSSMAGIHGSTEISTRSIRRTARFSENGKLIVHRVIEEVQGARETVDQMAASVRLINDLADQTHRIALNAAIEAAQVGREGTGFSVIAGEVRMLAEKSAGIAAEIGQMVKKAERVILNGGQSAREAGKIFDQIDKDLGGYAGFFGDLHKSVQEQLQANREVSRSIEKIAEAITAGSRAADHVREVIGELGAGVAGLKSLAGEANDSNHEDENIEEIEYEKSEEVNG